jgi:hypothetical protein
MEYLLKHDGLINADDADYSPVSREIRRHGQLAENRPSSCEMLGEALLYSHLDEVHSRRASPMVAPSVMSMC